MSLERLDYESDRQRAGIRRHLWVWPQLWYVLHSSSCWDLRVAIPHYVPHRGQEQPIDPESTYVMSVYRQHLISAYIPETPAPNISVSTRTCFRRNSCQMVQSIPRALSSSASRLLMTLKEPTLESCRVTWLSVHRSSQEGCRQTTSTSSLGVHCLREQSVSHSVSSSVAVTDCNLVTASATASGHTSAFTSVCLFQQGMWHCLQQTRFRILTRRHSSRAMRPLSSPATTTKGNGA